MRLIIVRHGETDHNRSGLLMGHAEVPLNNTGRNQAELIAERLASEKIHIIYSSDYVRTQETANAVFSKHPEARLVLDVELRERNCGIFSDRPMAEREAAEKASGLHYRDWKPDGGESLREVKVRAGHWYSMHRRTDLDKTVLVVSHGLFIYSLLEWVLEGGADVDRRELGHRNAAMTILEVPAIGMVSVVQLSDKSHLTS